MTSQTPAKLARKLKHIRKIELCYSIAEMAEALGPEVSERDVREFERGEQIPSLLRRKPLVEIPFTEQHIPKLQS